jgi:hypothetical protein
MLCVLAALLVLCGCASTRSYFAPTDDERAEWRATDAARAKKDSEDTGAQAAGTAIGIIAPFLR